MNISGKSEKKLRTKEPIKSEIELNYGIEIECVFELIDEFTTYIYFISYYLRQYIHGTYDNQIANLNQIIDELMELINTQYKSDDLTNNSVYNELLKIYNDDKQYNEYFINEFDLISHNAILIAKSMDEETPEKKGIKQSFIKKYIKQMEDISPLSSSDDENIQKFITFIIDLKKIINIIIDIIIEKYNNVDTSYEYRSKYYDFLNLLFLNSNNDGYTYNSLTPKFNYRFDLTQSKIKIYDLKTTIQDFYKKSSTTDKDTVHLYLTYDASVICTNKLIYNNIISGDVVNYKYLLNNCEFITQVFKNIDDIKSSLSIFFNDPVISKTILNCQSTSNHVHISFNEHNEIIKPNICIIIAIVSICHYFQDNIFELFLKTRLDNIYCKKLNSYTRDDDEMFNIYNYDDEYDKNLEKIFEYFYEGELSISDNRYYWLNLVNLYRNHNNIKRPPTIEFRIKHGSSDANELGNVCILYKNIINFAIKLTTDIPQDKQKNIVSFKNAINEYILTKDDIFHKILLKDIDYYFTSSNSEYVLGLNNLNRLLSKSCDIKRGGHLEETIKPLLLPTNKHLNTKKSNNIELFINNLNTKPIYKRNSFGYQLIGYGLDKQIISELKTKVINKSKIDNYLNSNNIFYNI